MKFDMKSNTKSDTKSDTKGRSAAFIASAAISVFLTGVIIIAHDVSGELRQSLTGLTGHHWTSVSAVALAIFLLTSTTIYLLTGSERGRQVLKADSLWAWSVALTAATLLMALGSLSIYILHYISA